MPQNDTRPLPEAAFVLPSAPWAGDEVLARALSALNAGQGAAPAALLVGGCVRNAVMGLPVSDYDIATRLTLDQVTEAARGAGFRAVPTGLAHGTVTLVADGRGFEVTRLRRDIQTDGRHAVVGFTDDWAVDAARRDFTMNALYADLSGQVYEFIPGSFEDARAGQVRFVGDPAARVAEDYLRILRFFRFHALYGQGEMDPAGLAACQAGAAHLRELSRERVTGEIRKWLAAKNPIESIKKSFEYNVLQSIFNEKYDLSLFDRLVQVQTAAGWPDGLARLLVLAGFDLDEIKISLRLSNNEINYLVSILNVRFENTENLNAVRRDMARYSPQPVLSALLLYAARAGRSAPDFFQELKNWSPPVFPITGKDLIAHGIPPGPALGAELEQLKEAWISSDFQKTKLDLLHLIKKETEH